MNDRLQQFLNAENINQAQFADSIGVARASVSHILAGRNKPGYDFILNMLKRYPDLNVEWLLTGQGRMYKSKTREQQPKAAAPANAYPVNLFDDLPDFEEPEQKSGMSGQNRTGEDRSFNAGEERPAASYGPADESEGISLQERRISDREHAVPRNIAATEGARADEGRAEFSARQRKAVKIVIFYDDSTFQEF